MKYDYRVYEAVQDFFRENYNQEITEEEIDKDLTRRDVLQYYLDWEGIRGYTNIILEILDM